MIMNECNNFGFTCVDVSVATKNSDFVKHRFGKVPGNRTLIKRSGILNCVFVHSNDV